MPRPSTIEEAFIRASNEISEHQGKPECVGLIVSKGAWEKSQEIEDETERLGFLMRCAAGMGRYA